MDGRDPGRRKVGETSRQSAAAKKARASDDAVLGGGTGGGGGASPTQSRASATAQDRRRGDPLVGGRSAMNQAAINAAGHYRPVRRQLDGLEADHESRNPAVVGDDSRSNADDVSGTAGGDGASSVDTSLTLDIGATASRVWWTRSQKGGRQIHAESEVASNSKNNKDLNDLLSSFMAKVTKLDKEHASMSSHVSRLLSSFERFQGMVQEEKILLARSKEKIEELQNQYVELMSENNGLKIEIEELKYRIIELQKTQEIVMVQHVEECQVAEDKIRRSESEAEISASNINRLEHLASELQGRIQKLLEDSTVAENHQQELLEKISKLESDNQELVCKVQSITYEKSNNAESLQREIAKHDQQVDTLESQVNQLHGILDEKEQLYSRSLVRSKTLEEQKLQVEASLAATECQLIEAKKQYDIMLEGKQIELSRHLKELSLKNDQAVNDIRKKYEPEKIEITNAEKQKAEKLIREMESKCNEKISENKIDSESYLIHLKEEHGAMVARIHQDNEHKESTLRAYHKEELQIIQSQAENELKENVNLSGILQSPISNILRKVEKGSQDIPKHSKVTHHEYEVETANRRITKHRKTRSTVMFGEPNTQKSLHSPIEKDATKMRKELKRGLPTTTDKKIAKLSKMSIPGNTALVVLDEDNLIGSRRSWRRGIKKAQAWCRANGIYKDLSKYLGPGAEVFTTPATGTFHMTFLLRQRRKKLITEKRLTIYLYGRTLYIKGWRSDNGLFEIQEKDGNPIYIRDPACIIKKIGFNYYDYVHRGEIEELRVGPFGIMNAFEVLFKCRGIIGDDERVAIATFSVNGSEPIRLSEVEDYVLESFDHFELDKLGKRGSSLPFQIKSTVSIQRSI